MDTVQIIGRRSSLFTRVPLLFAEELGVRYELVPIYDMTAIDPETYGGNPALKLPSVRNGKSLLFGAQNICRALAERSATPLRIVWPEDLRDDLSRNAQELAWQAMGAQVQLVFGTIIGELPADNIYFAKARAGFENSLRWLDRHAAEILRALPARDLSLFRVDTLLSHRAPGVSSHVAGRALSVAGRFQPGVCRAPLSATHRLSIRRTSHRMTSAVSTDPEGWLLNARPQDRKFGQRMRRVSVGKAGCRGETRAPHRPRLSIPPHRSVRSLRRSGRRL